MGYFTGPYEHRAKVGKPVVDMAKKTVSITLPNGVATDGYYTIDAQASYQIGRYSLGLSIINLTDRQYFEPYQFLAQSVVAPADPRGVLLQLRARY